MGKWSILVLGKVRFILVFLRISEKFKPRTEWWVWIGIVIA